MRTSRLRDLRGLYRDLRSRFATEECHGLVEEPIEEPMVLALRELTEGGCWVAGEERFIEELERRAGRYALTLDDFPSNLLGFHEYAARTRENFHDADLEVLDYRDLSHDSLTYWREEVTYLPGASGWGPEAPVLVCRRSCVLSVEYYWALGKVLKHWDPFSLSLLLFTESDEVFGPANRWIGPTFALVNILREHYPTFDNVPFEIAKLTSPPGASGPLPHYRDIHEYGQLFKLLPTDDYSAFHERMLASVPVLKEVGIRVRRVDRSKEPGAERHTDLSRTEWIIEAPSWDNPDHF